MVTQRRKDGERDGRAAMPGRKMTRASRSELWWMEVAKPGTVLALSRWEEKPSQATRFDV